MNALYTLGHSNRTIDQFLALLRSARITTLVDVRAQPYSTRYPQFSQSALRESLEAANVVYHWAGKSLGGLRTPSPTSVHIAINEEGFRGYADHMQTDVFARGAAQLIQLARHTPTCVMCAERLPEHCHRNYLSDYLLLQGVSVHHLIDEDHRSEHRLHPAARRESGTLIYDRHVAGRLF